MIRIYSKPIYWHNSKNQYFGKNTLKEVFCGSQTSISYELKTLLVLTRIIPLTYLVFSCICLEHNGLFRLNLQIEWVNKFNYNL